MTPIIECVPNISEGRDKAKIDAIVAAAAGVRGVNLLDVDAGQDTNRTVITFAGSPDAVLQGAFELVKRSAELIDMRTHSGAHPRMGACDVCPFIPVSHATMEDCVALARRLAERASKELGLPVYLYESAATRPERKNLANVRKGEYEGLAQKLKDPNWAPDFGRAEFNPKFGALITGARPFLIAYNVNLNTKSKKLANEIAKEIRESGKPCKDAQGNALKDKEGNPVCSPGLLQHCKAVGWFIESYGCAQVSINLTDFTITGMHHAFDACEDAAAKLGLRVTGSELVGLVPRQALMDAGHHYLKRQGAYSAVSMREVIHAAIRSLGLSELGEFKPAERIIEERLSESAPLVEMSLATFADELSSDSVAPGGGSVSALAGALSAALSNMVSAITFGKSKDEAHRESLLNAGKNLEETKRLSLEAVDKDTRAFNKVIDAMRARPKGVSEDSKEYLEGKSRVEDAYKMATLIPYQVAEQAVSTLGTAREVAEIGFENALSDLAVSGMMAKAALVGAAYNVRINLREIGDKAFVAEHEKKLMKLEDLGEAHLKSLLALVNKRLEFVG